MATKGTTEKTDIDRAGELFVDAHNRIDEITIVHAALCATLAETKRALTVQEEAIFLYEANEDALQHIPGGQNERERKYALAKWKSTDARYIENAAEVTSAERDVEQLTREVELVRFRISAVKRSMEFAIAWMHAIAGAA